MVEQGPGGRDSKVGLSVASKNQLSLHLQRKRCCTLQQRGTKELPIEIQRACLRREEELLCQHKWPTCFAGGTGGTKKTVPIAQAALGPTLRACKRCDRGNVQPKPLPPEQEASHQSPPFCHTHLPRASSAVVTPSGPRVIKNAKSESLWRPCNMLKTWYYRRRSKPCQEVSGLLLVGTIPYQPSSAEALMANDALDGTSEASTDDDVDPGRDTHAIFLPRIFTASEPLYTTYTRDWRRLPTMTIQPGSCRFWDCRGSLCTVCCQLLPSKLRSSLLTNGIADRQCPQSLQTYS